MATDPLTLVQNTLWSLLESNTDWAGKVPVGCRRKLITHWPFKETLGEGDVPEFVVVQHALTPLDRHASGTSSVLIEWRIWVTGEDFNYKNFLPVQWATIRALWDWDDAMHALLWKNKQFVFDCETVRVENSPRRRDLNRNVRRWTAIWAGTTDCWFDRDDIVTFT